MQEHTCDPLNDLHLIHEEKVHAGLLSIHPARWLATGKWIGRVFDIPSDEPQWIQVDCRRVTSYRALHGLNIERAKRAAGNVYFASSALARRYREFVPTGAAVETAIRDHLNLQDPTSTAEHKTPVGRIDCLHTTELVEVKDARYWKHGLGQLLAYSTYHPERKRVLHLFGIASDTSRLVEPAHICTTLNVVMKYQQVNGAKISPAVTISGRRK